VIAAGAWGRNLFPLPVANVEHHWVLYGNNQSDLQGKRHQDLNQTTKGLFDFDSGLYYNEFSGLTGIGSYAHKGDIVPDSTMKRAQQLAENPFTEKDFGTAKKFAEELFPKLKSKKNVNCV